MASHVRPTASHVNLSRHRETQDRLRAQREARRARAQDVKWLQSKIGAATDPWIQARIAELQAKPKGD